MKKSLYIAPSVMLATAMMTVSGAALAQDEGDEDVIVVRGALVPDEKRSTAPRTQRPTAWPTHRGTFRATFRATERLTDRLTG